MSVWTTLRLAFRALRAHPGITLPALVLLGLGVGAVTAVFTVVDHVLLRPLDIPHADRIVTVCEQRDEGADYCTAALPNVTEWAARSSTLEEIGAAREWSYSYGAPTGLRTIDAGLAMPGFLRALGMTPVLGRTLQEDDVLPRGAGRVVLLSHPFWQAEFAGAADVIGRTLELDDEAYEIIGVMPPEIEAPRLGDVSVWLPLRWDPADEENRDWRGFVTAGRLAPGTSVQAAQAEIASLYSVQIEAHPEELRGGRVQVVGMQDRIVMNVRPLLLIFLAAVSLVLLLVCINVAALLLARATARDREMAVRIALGGRTYALARQLFGETLLLAGLGGALGAVIAHWCVRAFVSLAPAGIPRIDEIAVDARILLFTLAVTVATGVLFGFVPLLRMRLVDVGQVFRAGIGGSARGSWRARQALVVVQLALALVLVTGAGLLLRSFSQLLDWQPGFDASQVLTFQVFPPNPSYPDDDALRALYARMESELAALPGVTATATASAGPLFGGGDGGARFLLEGSPDQDIARAPSVNWYDVGPGYFAALGLPILRGRGFTEDDRAGAPLTAVVNRAMAERTWPNGDPLGARVHLPMLELTVEVVGVVEEVPPFLPGTPTPPEIYFSNRQFTRGATFFVVRTTGDAAALSATVRSAVERIDPDIVPSRMQPLQVGIEQQLVRPRFNMLLIGLLAVISLVLGVVGVYGLIAYTIEARRREIGIRLAIGASPAQLFRWALRSAGALVLAGALAGTIGALFFNRLLSSIIYGVSPTDPVTFVGSVALLTLCGLAAAVRPAVRASHVDPLQSLHVQ